MRQIQFRGKSKGTGEWVYGGIVHQTDFYGTTVDRWFIIDGAAIGEDDIGTFEPEVDPDTVGQKVEQFYEGDIIDYFGSMFLIEYSEKDNAFIGRHVKVNSYVPLTKRIASLSEVVGNKWDNPELLN